jgi:SAM-dependent methyltransferase
MKEFLIECGGREARPTTPDAWDQNLPNVLSRYIQAHYGNITEQLERNPGPWPDFVKAYVDSGADLYSVLLSMVGKALSGNQGLSAGIAVDAGCSVGKLTYELAPNFQSVYGVDLSFSAILTARRIVNRSPVPQTSYSIVTDAGRWSNSIPIQVHDRPNVEFLVSSATDLPFETGSLSFLATVNLIDVLPQPEALFRESARVLGEQRSLLMADPYCWKDTGASQEHYSSSEYVVESLLEHGFMVTEHRDSIPWLLRLHDRRWDTYLCDCFGAVKTSKSGKEEKIQ